VIISPEIRKIADDFFANTVENNEVMIVKWTFPDGQLPDLTLERAQRDYELADETEAKVEALLAAGGLTHEDENRRWHRESATEAQGAARPTA